METKRLKSFHIVAILFVFGNLVGCKTEELQNVIPLKNEEKDQYIEKVESIVSDSASALTAIAGSLDKGDARDLLQGQVVRLSGVSKPSVAKVEEYSRMLAQNDSKAIQRDRDEAEKIDAETDALYALVLDKDKKIEEANSKAEIADRRADKEFKQKILWALSCLGMAVSTGGLMVIAFTPWKIRGLILVAGGGLAVASVWILNSEWFKYILISLAVILVLDVLYMLFKHQTKKTTPSLDSNP